MLFPITKSTINKKKKINDTESNFASNDIIIGAYRSLQSSHFLIPRNTYMLTAVNFESLQHHERNYLLYGLVYAYCQVVTFTTTQLLQKSGRFQTVWTKNCSSEDLLHPLASMLMKVKIASHINVCDLCLCTVCALFCMEICVWRLFGRILKDLIQLEGTLSSSLDGFGQKWVPSSSRCLNICTWDV
jgi:hypothetical protein